MILPASSPRPLSAFERSRLASCGSYEDYQRLLHDEYRLPEIEEDSQRVFRANCFRSGEISGAFYLVGAQSKATLPIRTGPVVTTCLSQKSKSKIRRAVENSCSDLTTFLTLTFSPWGLNPWEIAYFGPFCQWHRRGVVKLPLCVGGLRENKGGRIQCRVVPSRFSSMRVPVVRHDFAKAKLANFRKALTMKVNRQIKCKLSELPESQHDRYTDENKFRLVWVAELQKNGNIHFHMLCNKYIAKAYLSKIWPYGMTNIKKLNDPEHAAHYMVKYISKDENSTIQGNRYNISQKLREESKPMGQYYKTDNEATEMKRLMGLMKEEVEKRGGKVIDSGFGFIMPRPRREKVFRDKNGQRRKTRGVDRRMHKAFLDACFPVPF